MFKPRRSRCNGLLGETVMERRQKALKWFCTMSSSGYGPPTVRSRTMLAPRPPERIRPPPKRKPLRLLEPYRGSRNCSIRYVAIGDPGDFCAVTECTTGARKDLSDDHVLVGNASGLASLDRLSGAGGEASSLG